MNRLEVVWFITLSIMVSAMFVGSLKFVGVCE